jgi:flagellar basal body-associated protein FliL
MAMEKPKEAPPQPAAARGGGSKLAPLFMAITAVLLAVAIGLAVFLFVLRPRLSEGPEASAGEGEAHGEPVPAHTVDVAFDEAFATVKMPSPDLPASTLLYQVTLECSDQAAADKIKANMARFTAMVRQLHSYRERKELDDPLVEQSIERQIQQEANKMLKELPDPPAGEHGSAEKSGADSRVTAVYHVKFFVQDM